MLMLRYYEGLQRCVGLYSENGNFSPDEIDRLDTLYKSLRQQFKWSSAVKVVQSILELQYI
jgi:peptide alpha-N-acetyltransferase